MLAPDRDPSGFLDLALTTACNNLKSLKLLIENLHRYNEMVANEIIVMESKPEMKEKLPEFLTAHNQSKLKEANMIANYREAKTHYDKKEKNCLVHTERALQCWSN